ncbi:hypothetical protein CDAIGKPJ_01725 [Aeromonas salmonicida]
MGFFHLVQQHHRIGFLTNGFGQHAPFAKADIAGRRADQAGDCVFFLILGHVDGGQILATAKHQLGNLQHSFSLADPAWPHQQEGPQRTARAAQVGAGGQQVFVQMGHRHIQPLDKLAQVLRQPGYHIQLPLRDAIERHPGPLGDHGRHLGFVDMGRDQHLTLLQLGQLALEPGKLLGSRLRIQRRISEIQRLSGQHLILLIGEQGGAQFNNLMHQPLLLLPLGFLLAQGITAGLLGRLQLGQSLCVVTQPDQTLALQLADLQLTLTQCVLQMADGTRRRSQVDGHPGTGGIEHVDRLVRQLTT